MDKMKLLDAALNYAIASNKIEDMELTEEELKEVKEYIKKNDNSLMMLINDIMKRMDEEDGKDKRSTRV